MGWFAAKRNWGLLVLAIWLIVYGALHFVHIDRGGDILAVLAIAAGVLLLLGR